MHCRIRNLIFEAFVVVVGGGFGLTEEGGVENRRRLDDESSGVYSWLWWMFQELYWVWAFTQTAASNKRHELTCDLRH
jgi:hypothetical protein